MVQEYQPNQCSNNEKKRFRSTDAEDGAFQERCELDFFLSTHALSIIASLRRFWKKLMQSSQICHTIMEVQCVPWWRIGRVKAFQAEGRGFESRSSRHVRTLGRRWGSHKTLPDFQRGFASDRPLATIWYRSAAFLRDDLRNQNRQLYV